MIIRYASYVCTYVLHAYMHVCFIYAKFRLDGSKNSFPVFNAFSEKKMFFLCEDIFMNECFLYQICVSLYENPEIFSHVISVKQFFLFISIVYWNNIFSTLYLSRFILSRKLILIVQKFYLKNLPDFL